MLLGPRVSWSEFVKLHSGDTNRGGNVPNPILEFPSVFRDTVKTEPYANARCPLCGHNFNIPEYRDRTDLVKLHRCPNCVVEASGMNLYKR
jgi:hypothetical protein